MKKFQILILLCSLLFTNLLFADDYKKEHHKYEKNHIYKNLDFLNLNKKQYSKIREILINYKKEYRAFYQFKLNEEKKLQALVEEKIFDKASYITISQNIKQHAIQIEANNIEDILSILNPMQRKKFSYYLEEWEVE